MKHLSALMSLCLAGTLLTGCAVATAGVKKGDERNFARSVNDVSAARVIKARMTRALDYKLKGVDVEVKEGVVLLSGNAPRQEDRIEAARIAWSAPRIEQVGNEIMIKGKQGFIRNTKDGWLEKSVRARMTTDKLVKARNYSVETHDGIVYLMGVARTQSELERAAAIASTTKGTREVISYVTLADLPASERMRLTQEAENYLAPPAPPRALPNFLTTEPMVSGVPQSAPLSSPMPFNGPLNAPASEAYMGGPTAPPTIDMGDRINQEFPTDEELGAYRTGKAGEAASIIESAPYYVDPETGAEIPVRFDPASGTFWPILVR